MILERLILRVSKSVISISGLQRKSGETNANLKAGFNKSQPLKIIFKIDSGADMKLHLRRHVVTAVIACNLAFLCCEAAAQQTLNWQTNTDWAVLPEGRTWGAVTGVHPDPDGRHIWVLDRCGANTCLDSSLSPIFKIDLAGNVVANFGAGLLAWPHGLFVDHAGNVWVTDGGTGRAGERAAQRGMGHQVLKFNPQGDVVMRLGKAGEAGSGPDTFNGPSVVAVSLAGEIFIADGHGEDGNNRIVKFSESGDYITEWGSSGPGPAAGEFNDVHALAFDSSGRLFVGDRRNIRIQIYDSEGNFLDAWSQFGPPSSIYIDANDMIYVTDTQTIALPQWYQDRRTPSWIRGIRVGSAISGQVTGFLKSDAEFLTVDSKGNIYGAEVPEQRITKYLNPQ